MEGVLGWGTRTRTRHEISKRKTTEDKSYKNKNKMKQDFHKEGAGEHMLQLSVSKFVQSVFLSDGPF